MLETTVSAGAPRLPAFTPCPASSPCLKCSAKSLAAEQTLSLILKAMRATAGGRIAMDLSLEEFRDIIDAGSTVDGMAAAVRCPAITAGGDGHA
ncbi:hypothetical protein ACFSCV_01675 [Methylopila henanensis]|uniref:Uncharacterized protein n=1 Tax=Methylopila henanensis TaxID=873516 RepID=A0ABW4K2Q5_9HYPH